MSNVQRAAYNLCIGESGKRKELRHTERQAEAQAQAPRRCASRQDMGGWSNVTTHAPGTEDGQLPYGTGYGISY